MKIEGVKGEFDPIVLPTLEEAIEICKKFEEPVNGNVILLVPKAPNTYAIRENQTKALQLGDTVTAQIQQIIDQEGLLVVKQCVSTLDIPRYEKVKAGKYVYLDPGMSAIGKMVVTNPKNNQKYIVIISNINAIVATILPPNYPMK